MDSIEKESHKELQQKKAQDLLKEAFGYLEKGEKLDLAFHQFNILLNETIHKKNESDLDILLFYLGCVNMKMGHNALAIFLFKEALKYRPDFVATINNLGYVFKKEGLSDQARDCFQEVIRIVEENSQEIPDKDKAEYYTNLGSCMIANGAPQKALDYFNKALALDGEKDVLRWNRGLAYLELAEYEKGFVDYCYGERGDLARRRVYYQDSPLPDWDGTPGKNVVVYGEQGIGDEIMFASMLPDLANDCKFTFDCHPRLVTLFREAYPGLTVYGTRKTEIKEMTWLHFHKKFDAKIAIGSLAQFYRKSADSFPKTPYIVANEKLSTKYAIRLQNMPGDRPKIGFSWKGGIKTTNGTSRYIPLELWNEIFKLDADFISLQYNKDAIDEVKEFERKYGWDLNHWPDVLADYDETCALVDNLDLIISVPQSVVHLAGAMGKIVWQLAPHRSMWQVGKNGDDMPWYAHVTNFWQDADEKWEPVLIRVKDELCKLFQTNTAS